MLMASVMNSRDLNRLSYCFVVIDHIWRSRKRKSKEKVQASRLKEKLNVNSIYIVIWQHMKKTRFA